MNAEETVFGIEDLRRHIFSYLRSKPYKSCQYCQQVLEWNPNDNKCEYLEWANFLPTCFPCFRENFIGRNPYFGCCIT